MLVCLCNVCMASVCQSCRLLAFSDGDKLVYGKHRSHDRRKRPHVPAYLLLFSLHRRWVVISCWFAPSHCKCNTGAALLHHQKGYDKNMALKPLARPAETKTTSHQETVQEQRKPEANQEPIAQHKIHGAKGQKTTCCEPWLFVTNMTSCFLTSAFAALSW